MTWAPQFSGSPLCSCHHVPTIQWDADHWHHHFLLAHTLSFAGYNLNKSQMKPKKVLNGFGRSCSWRKLQVFSFSKVCSQNDRWFSQKPTGNVWNALRFHISERCACALYHQPKSVPDTQVRTSEFSPRNHLGQKNWSPTMDAHWFASVYDMFFWKIKIAQQLDSTGPCCSPQKRLFLCSLAPHAPRPCFFLPILVPQQAGEILSTTRGIPLRISQKRHDHPPVWLLKYIMYIYTYTNTIYKYIYIYYIRVYSLYFYIMCIYIYTYNVFWIIIQALYMLYIYIHKFIHI